MSIPNTGRRRIRPTHPGEMLREDFVTDYGLTTSRLAEALGVSRQTVNELLRGRRAMSPEMALRLAAALGALLRVRSSDLGARGPLGSLGPLSLGAQVARRFGFSFSGDASRRPLLP